jgi:hypothetical protein
LTTKLGRCHSNVCTAETGSQLLTATSYSKQLALTCSERQTRTLAPPKKDTSRNNNYLFDKKKVELFFTGFFLVLKRAVLSRVRPGEGLGVHDLHPR